MNEVTQTVRGVEAAAVADWAKGARDRATAPWLRWAGPILSLAIIAVVADALGRRDVLALWHMTPSAPGFWIGVAVFLSIQPVADFLIFRGLWPLPLAGLGALFRKSASNELLFGYSGELQFYLWARQNAALPGSPFGAVRDVAVMSALVGNVVTIALLLGAIALPGDLAFGSMEHSILWSAIILVGSSMAIMLFRNRVLAVTREQFWRIGAIHLVRSVAMTLMVGLLWAMVVPGVSLGWWLLLAAARQFVTRLPFLPNKDLVFAGLAAGTLKTVPNVAETVALVAGVIFAGQVLIGVSLAIADLAREATAGKER
ncbi:MAG: hypothetical protein E7773_02000 [Sphingomonas sp.]|uniref:hypothetical protein n=1 Tax=Sphingomonas sp. TaxID=28214 RepID=UPI00121DFDED|nr:hypothetical protein [Sphingomonas sp.]THD37778.1 MAG: hypothetical protein E7773_02000 [Sphingomonas sp.]